MISLWFSLPLRPARLTISPPLMVAFEARQIVTAITISARPTVAIWRQWTRSERELARRLGSFSQLGYFYGGDSPEAIYSGTDGTE